MKLADVTPLILTYNEGPNLRTTLDALSWASQIVIVDSFSTDDTLEIAGQYPQVKVVYRQFDHFADQCNFGLSQIVTPWTLSLDADYVCPPGLPDELQKLQDQHAGYRAPFRYCIYGRPLRGTLYPPRVVLYRTEKAQYRRDGHAHKVTVDGSIGSLQSHIDHDDHKPLSRWLHSQTGYARLEAEKILAIPTSQLHWKDRLRKLIFVAPPLTLVYCLLWKRLILDGWPGIHYALQRTYAELLLALMLVDQNLRPQPSKLPANPDRQLDADRSPSADPSTDTQGQTIQS